jgi:Fungal chitosanase of glycosyl hydrolase group 75
MTMAYQPKGLAVYILDKIVDLIANPKTQTISEFFHGKTFMCKFPNGQLYFESKLDLDTDGSRFAIPDATGHKQDPAGQATTSAIDADGNFLDADQINYFVLPGPCPHAPAGSAFFRRHGIRIGDIGVVINGISIVYACFGDVGPCDKLGEGSISLHRELGHETVFRGRLSNSGLSQAVGVITIVFPGSGNGFGRTNWESAWIGEPLFRKLKKEAETFEQLRIAELQELLLEEEREKNPLHMRLRDDRSGF